MTSRQSTAVELRTNILITFNKAYNKPKLCEEHWTAAGLPLADFPAGLTTAKAIWQEIYDKSAESLPKLLATAISDQSKGAYRTKLVQIKMAFDQLVGEPPDYTKLRSAVQTNTSWTTNRVIAWPWTRFPTAAFNGERQIEVNPLNWPKSNVTRDKITHEAKVSTVIPIFALRRRTIVFRVSSPQSGTEVVQPALSAVLETNPPSITEQHPTDAAALSVDGTPQISQQTQYSGAAAGNPPTVADATIVPHANTTDGPSQQRLIVVPWLQAVSTCALLALALGAVALHGVLFLRLENAYLPKVLTAVPILGILGQAFMGLAKDRFLRSAFSLRYSAVTFALVCLVAVGVGRSKHFTVVHNTGIAEYGSGAIPPQGWGLLPSNELNTRYVGEKEEKARFEAHEEKVATVLLLEPATWPLLIPFSGYQVKRLEQLRFSGCPRGAKPSYGSGFDCELDISELGNKEDLKHVTGKLLTSSRTESRINDEGRLLLNEEALQVCPGTFKIKGTVTSASSAELTIEVAAPTSVPFLFQDATISAAGSSTRRDKDKDSSQNKLISLRLSGGQLLWPDESSWRITPSDRAALLPLAPKGRIEVELQESKLTMEFDASCLPDPRTSLVVRTERSSLTTKPAHTVTVTRVKNTWERMGTHNGDGWSVQLNGDTYFPYIGLPTSDADFMGGKFKEKDGEWLLVRPPSSPDQCNWGGIKCECSRCKGGRNPKSKWECLGGCNR